MVKTREIKCIVRPVSIEMDELIKKIQDRFIEVHGIKPKYYEVTKMVAKAVNKKAIFI